MIKNDLFLRAARRRHTERTPVWLMRQAGRFDPAYREIRERVDLPLEDLFRDPGHAAEISLLPRRFGVDAIIFFQDILTPLTPMGAPFKFRPGPVLESPLRTASDINALKSFDPADELDFVAQTLRMIRQTLRGALPLLGFAGAPLTLAFFMIEGKSPGVDPEFSRALMRSQPALFERLLDRLTDMTADYLAMQIEAGADAVQLFESCADLLSPAEYQRFAHPGHVKIFARLAGKVPTILFAKGNPSLELMVESGADVLSVGTAVDLADARRRFGHRVAFQGNIDHHLLATGAPDDVERAVRACVDAGAGCGHILNLNHGLLHHTPVENVRRMIQTCKAARVAVQEVES